ncbi:MAG: B12-binding domain-containing radical SAM protein [Chitinophagales bacterium]|nr:B12-binding domain-containing radical SAM protein [Chitinophagales bacterium]
MKITLIRPPKVSVKDAPMVRPHPPLGLSLIAGVLKKAGHKVKLIDAAPYDTVYPFREKIFTEEKGSIRDIIIKGLSYEDIIARIPHDVEMVGVSCMFTTDWISDRSLIEHIKIKFPKAIIVSGGEHMTAIPEISLKQCPSLQIAIIGEGEDTILDLVDAIEQGKNLENVKGIVYKNENNEIIVNPRRARMVDIRNTPYPAWEELDLTLYPKHTGNTATLPILATRGCPFQCTFCSSPIMWGTKYIMRTPEEVITEMRYNIEHFHTNSFDFFDLTAIIKKNWVIEFAKLIKEEKLTIFWRIPAGTRSEAIDEEVTKALFESGCRFITYAPESGSVRLLKEIKKKVNLENLKQSMTFSKKNGLAVYSNMMIALPEETFYDQLQTMKFLMQLAKIGVDDIALAFYRFYPGSQLFHEAVEKKVLDPNKDDYIIDNINNFNRFIQSNPYSSKKKHARNIIIGISYLVVFYSTMLFFHPKQFRRIIKYGTAYNYFGRIYYDIKKIILKR